MTARKFISKDSSGRKGRLDHDANMFISEAFLTFLASIFGNFHRHYEPGTFRFKYDEFRAAAPKQHHAVRTLIAHLSTCQNLSFTVKNAARGRSFSTCFRARKCMSSLFSIALNCCKREWTLALKRSSRRRRAS